jgi:arginine utilization protein RocB
MAGGLTAGHAPVTANKTRRKNVHALFRDKLLELQVTYQEFFRTAYVWKFGKMRDLTCDYASYRLAGTLPRYVIEYLEFLKQGEKA